MKLERPQGLVSYGDIGHYQNCPLLFTRFHAPSVVKDPSSFDQAKRLLFNKLLTKIFELQYVPTVGSMGMVLKAEYKKLRDSGFDKPMLNSLTMHLSNMLDTYHRVIHSLSYRIIARGYDLVVSYGSITFKEEVPALLITSKKEIIPMFDKNIDIVSKNNYIRFTCAALEINAETQVDHCIIYDNSNSTNKMFLIYHFNDKEIYRAKKELTNILKQMNDTQHTPNTEHCSQCSFIQKCKL